MIDLVAGEPDKPVAIDCRIDPAGVAAHIDKATTLRRIGWDTADAYELRWGYRLDDYVDDLLQSFPHLAARS